MTLEISVLVVDDDRDFLDILRGRLMDAGFRSVTVRDDPKAAAALIEKGRFFDIVLIDMTMPNLDGLQFLDIVKRFSPRSECIMVTAVNEARVAVECLKKGAYDYLVKPISREDLIFSLQRTLEHQRLLDLVDIGKGHRRPRLANPAPFRSILTRSERLFRILKEAELHARSDVPILITGESGTGKELLARAIHKASRRSGFAFTPVNMASIAGTLFESEFFGHTKGAFTGAERQRAGYLEHSNRGTLFLDEIGNMPADMQGKLLRMLQDGEYTKLGSDSHRRANVRFIAATNADLEQKMAEGSFRKDLYYRIRGGWLHLPPLKDRREDIPLLAQRFLKGHCGEGGTLGIEEDALCLLVEYEWPGNIRELKSVIQSAANLSQGRPLSVRTLPADLRRQARGRVCPGPARNRPLLSLAAVEREHILDVFAQTGGNKSRTSRLLGIGLNTLRRKLKAYGGES